MVQAEINWPEQPEINNIGAKACPKRTPSSRSRSLFLFRIRKSVLTDLCLICNIYNPNNPTLRHTQQ